MEALRRRLRDVDDERGMSLVEVVVALMIFALIATGLVYSLLAVKVLSRDARARQVAANLAAQEIDLAHDTGDLFGLLDATRTTVLNGDTYTVTRKTQWVSDPDAEIQCGSGGSSTLRYKRVNITVTWTNMREGTSPVRSDTIVQPGEKINDPAKGTIIVSVKGSAGSGVEGVAISAVPGSPSNGASPLTTAPSATDAQGCSYILKVVPGTYVVSASKSGFVDQAQASPSQLTVGVKAGESATAQFQYDQAATYTISYGSNYSPGGSEVYRTGDTLATTFTNTYGTFVRSSPSTTSMNRSFSLHPYSSGYEVYAGTCEAADPLAWPDKVQGGSTLVGTRAPAAAAVPGGTATTGVPMGVIRLQTPSYSTGSRYLRAVAQSTGGDDPGCSTPTEITFGFSTATRVPYDGKMTVALPWGSWKLFYGTSTTSSANTTAVTSSMMSFPSGGTLSTISSSGVVTLDPRAVAP